MNSDLLRQRRNLMLISGMLIMFDFAQVSIAKVSILGTELIIGKPTVLIMVAWALWAYFFLRYYQYVREEKDLKILSTFSDYFNRLVRDYAKLKAVQDKYGQQYSDFRLRRVGYLKWEYALQGYDTSKGETIDQTSKSIPFIYIIFWFIKSLVFLAANTPRITDHVLPIIIALLSPLVAYFF